MLRRSFLKTLAAVCAAPLAMIGGVKAATAKPIVVAKSPVVRNTFAIFTGEFDFKILTWSDRTVEVFFCGKKMTQDHVLFSNEGGLRCFVSPQEDKHGQIKFRVDFGPGEDDTITIDSVFAIAPKPEYTFSQEWVDFSDRPNQWSIPNVRPSL
jgi:hypothetical protein